MNTGKCPMNTKAIEMGMVTSGGPMRRLENSPTHERDHWCKLNEQDLGKKYKATTIGHGKSEDTDVLVSQGSQSILAAIPILLDTKISIL